jgi:hypothetical protein
MVEINGKFKIQTQKSSLFYSDSRERHPLLEEIEIQLGADLFRRNVNV